MKSGLEALLAAGRLGALLAQFPYSFHNTQENRAYLVTVRERFPDYPLAIEVRHRSWEQPAVRQFLADHHLAFCNIDQPQISYSLGETDWVSGPFAYLRLHGRNRQNWFAKTDDAGARYDYLYTPQEMDEQAARARKLAAQAGETYLIFNNHPRGQGVANALEMSRAADGPAAGPAGVFEAGFSKAGVFLRKRLSAFNGQLTAVPASLISMNLMVMLIR